jgi:hypothetical protein
VHDPDRVVQGGVLIFTVSCLAYSSSSCKWGRSVGWSKSRISNEAMPASCCVALRVHPDQMEDVRSEVLRSDDGSHL